MDKELIEMFIVCGFFIFYCLLIVFVPFIHDFILDKYYDHKLKNYK